MLHLYEWERRKIHSASVADSYKYYSRLILLGIMPKAGPVAQKLKRRKLAYYNSSSSLISYDLTFSFYHMFLEKIKVKFLHHDL